MWGWLKNVGKGALAVGTGGASLLAPGLRPGSDNGDAEAAAKAQQLAAGQASDKQQLRALLAQTPAYASSIANPQFEQLKSEAFGTGPMAAYEAQRKQQQALADQDKVRIANSLSDNQEATNASNAGTTANAYSQLAMGGGLSSGARERVAAGGALNSLAARQSNRLQASRDQTTSANNLQNGFLGIGANEAAARTGQQNSITDAINKDQLARNQYNTDMYGKKADLESGFLKSNADARLQQLYGAK